MKAEIIETKKNFEPIGIKLVIETEEELCDLLNRLNMAQDQVNAAHLQNKFLKKAPLITSTGKGSLFSELENIAYKYDLVL